MEDFLLIIQMKQGKEDAFDKFIHKYYSKILQYCKYHCIDTDYAEGLTQETFLNFFSNIEAYNHIGKAKNYLYTIAGNLCKNLKKKKADNVVGQDELDDKATCDSQVDILEKRIDIEQALMKIPIEFREVIIMFYFDELKLTEIAKILKIGVPLVKYRLKQGKEKLKKLLGKEEE